MRHAFLTCLWHREELARVVLRHTKAVAPPGSIFVAVASRPADVALALEEGWHVAEHENRPLSSKWQAGLDMLRGSDVGSVTILGSDDVLSLTAVDRLLAAVLSGAHVVGVSGCWVWRPADERIVLWPGYRGARQGEPIGTGRTFSRAILDDLDWKLWPDAADSGLDQMAWERLAGAGGALNREGGVVLFQPHDAPILDVKTDADRDMGSFDVAASEGAADDRGALRAFKGSTLKAIRELADPVASTPRIDAAPNPILAACLVVKDEAAYLPRCLRSLVGVVDEVVAVVDSRTTDRTRAILTAAGAWWIELDWEGFALARNAGLEETSAPWRLIIDADEVLEDGAAVRAAALAAPTGEANALAVAVGSVVGSGSAVLHRLAVRVIGPDVTYRYRRHNEPVGVRGVKTVRAYIRTSYAGRLAVKAEGTIRDLLAEWEEEKTQHAAAYLAHAYRGVGEFEAAIRWANESLGIDAMNQYGVMSWLDLVHATQAARGFEEGDDVLRRATALHPGCADLWHSWLATIAFRWARAAADPGAYRWLPQVSTPQMALLLPGLVEALRLPLARMPDAPAAPPV